MKALLRPLLTAAFLIITCVLLPHLTRAGTEPYENFLKGKIKKKDTLLVKDEKFRNASFNWNDINNISVKNNITLRLINQASLKQSFNAELDLKVEYFTRPDQDTAKVIKKVRLKIFYDHRKGASYKNVDTYGFTGAYWVKVTVTRAYSKQFGTDLPPNLLLTNSIAIDRQYKFKPAQKLKLQSALKAAAQPATTTSTSSTTTTTANTTTTTTTSRPMMRTLSLASPTSNAIQAPASGSSSGGSTLTLTWQPVTGANEYDLEWTTVDTGSDNMSVIQQMQASNSVDPAVLNSLFRNNATRVTTSANSYTVSLMYNDDYLAARVRQVQYDSNGIRIEGNWDYTLGSTTGYAVWPISDLWHQPNLNWQYSAAFAEEAKKKEVVSYFDGTLRGRQTVTINNSDNIPVAQENVYDQFGRPTVSMLPAPFKDANGTTLHYVPNFNLSLTGTPYSFQNLNTTGCEVLPDSVSDNSGAGQYYSVLNQFKNDNVRNKFIPQAQGYPLSVTQYTPDNTGRILLQGGVGPTFQPGMGDINGSHTTKYYYGKPEQWELDQLFGNDAGYAEHYQKNMVVDPNGQISISYLNASGKTVATALTGMAPTNLSALPSQGPVKRQTIHVLKPNQFVFNGTDLKLTATTTYLASVSGTDTISYNIQQLIDSYPGSAFSICSHCFYNLTIKVANDCNQPVYSTTTPVPIGALHDTTCTALSDYASSFALTLPKIGEYYITFELALSKSSIESYVNSYVLKGQQLGVLNSESYYLYKYLNGIDFSGCLSDCSTALQTLGDSTSFRVMFENKIQNAGVNLANIPNLDNWIHAKWDSLHTVCLNAWNNCNLAPCNDVETTLEEDVSPGGQYALFDSNGNPLEVEINVLYNFWYAVFPSKPSTDPLYQQNLITRADGSVTSPYDSNFSWTDVLTYWQSSWASRFVQYHPEYCKLQFCQANSSYENWDAKVKLQTKVSDLAANCNITYNQSDPLWLLSADPFFASSGSGNQYYSQMQSDLQNYSSQVSGITDTRAGVKNISQMVDYVLYCSNTKGNINQGGSSDVWNNCTPNSSCRVPDRELQEYQDFYFELKDKYYNMLRQATTCANVCPVGEPVLLPVPGACPTTNQFVISGSANANSDSTQVTVTYLAGAVGHGLTISLYYPSGLTATGPATIHFAATDNSQTFNIPGNIPVSAIHISNLACDQPTVPVCPFTQGSLVGTWCYNSVSTSVNGGASSYSYPTGGIVLSDGFYSMSTDNVTKNGSWVLSGDQCKLILDQGTQNEVDYTIVNAGNSQLNLTTTVGSTVTTYSFHSCPNLNCPIPEHIDNAVLYFYQDTYKIGDNNSGNIYSISSTPQNSCQSYGGLTVYYGGTQYYDCFIVNTTSGQQIFYYNVYVTNCNYNNTGSGGGGGTPPRPYSVTMTTAMQSNTTSTSGANSLYQSLMKNKEPKEIITADYNTNTVYSIKFDTLHVKKSGLPKQKKGFEPYVYRPVFMIQLASKSYVRYDSIFIAAMLPQAGSPNDIKAKKGTSSSKNITSTTTTAPMTMMTAQTAASCPMAFQYKISRYPDISQTNTYASTPPDSLTADGWRQVTNQVNSACVGNAQNWLKALTPGLLAKYPNPADYTSVSNQLLASFTAICEAGGDTTHMMGASTLPPGVQPQQVGLAYGSFGDAIKGICGISTFTEDLNPWLIQSPPPYSPKLQAVQATMSTTDANICARLAHWETIYTTDQSLATFLNISVADLNALKQSCTNCQFLLPYDMKVPIPLGGSPGCISRDDFNSAISEMQADFGNNLPVNDTTYRTIYATFLNQKWGFALSYDQYKAFADSTAQTTLCNQTPYYTTSGDPWDCLESQIAVSVSNGERDYSTYIENQKSLYRANYIGTCSMAQASADLHSAEQQYHYTLYYYDQADNLVRTVPPEGVTLLSDADQVRVDQARDLEVDDCTYTGPQTSSDKTAALTNLQTILDNSAPTAIEMWLYNSNPKALKHFVEVDPNQHYLVQATVSGNTVGVDVYPLTNAATGTITFGPTSGHYRATIPANLLPLAPWVHMVVQGSALGTNANTPQLYLGGNQLTVTNAATPMPGGWTVAATSTGIIYPDSMQTLKHLRLYTRLMSPDEIKANANDNCLNPSNTNQMAWYRFNVPAPGDGSTISGYSTVEVQHPPVYPPHGLPTTYAYNSTNQVQTQTSPDGGSTNYWYDLLSRLTASQNAKQLSAGATTYSYTTYDNLGRIIEVGQKQNGNNLNSPDYVDSTTTANFLASGNNTQITRTYYDNLSGYTGSMLTTLGQSNLRKRVAASIYLDDPNTLISGMYYNYDLDGNVRTLYRQLPGLDTKQIGYEYDLISGKVNFVAYQQNQPDQFYYSYNYDADNRLTEAWSSPLANVVSYGRGSTLDQTYKRMDASYYYYPHGPLARMELGDVYGKVQGVDYAYTLQGWLKGVNTTAVDMSKDISGDGFNGSTIAKDAYGYALHYFNNDFKPVGTTISPFDQPAAGFTPLYNGNIAGSSMNLSQFAGYRQDYLYNYDQLNRILTVGVFRGSQYGQTATSTPENNEVFSYDGNGNIKGLLRNGTQAQGLQMDLLSYSYNKESNGKLLNNQLNSVTDDPSSSNNYSSDLKGSTSYTYDQIGNLLTDSHEGITNIDWSVYGKIRNIYKTSGNISYQYDPAGNRQSKIYNNITTWYVRDAQGNTLAVYDNSGNQVNWLEQHLYGSSRIGMWMPNMPVINNNALNIWNTTGHKQYELSNHLGNVVTTVSDVINADASGNPLPDILSAQDYYAFGSQQPNRSYARSNAYRYGFNGKENDNDVGKGPGNEQDYGMRIYDPRVGRFLSVDPLTKEYAALTPYQFASNSPIAGVDRDGLEIAPFEMMRAEQSIREYESDLYKKDPKHAEEIIRQHNINAFLFVGGSLTGGSGKLATAFWDGVIIAGGTRFFQGIINHNKTQTTEGVHVMFGAAMGEVGGMLIGKTFEIVSPLMRAAGKSLTGTWIKENIRGWSENAVRYQEFVTGVKAGQTFQVNGYNFDGFRNGTLLDAKSGLGNFVDKQTGTFKQFFKGQESLVIQARNQLGAAKGAPIEWNFEIKAVRDATEKLFEKEGIKGITLKYTPKK